MHAHYSRCACRFLVISGDDPITLPFIAMGMQGVISVVGNAYPKDFSNMVRESLQHQFSTANPLHYKLLDFTELIFKEGSPAGVKYALKNWVFVAIKCACLYGK